MNIMTIAEPMRRRRGVGYGLALGLALLNCGGLVVFEETLRGFPFLLPITAVTLAAFLAGWGPATLIAIVSLPFLQYFILPPFHSFELAWPSAYIGLGFYLFVCAIIIGLMHAVFAAQTSLQNLNDELEARVAARTRELRATNQNLETIVETRIGELRVANEEIQRFAYIVSHDLRAPLVNVLGFTSELDALRSDLGAFLDKVAARSPDLITPDIRRSVMQELPESIGFIRTSAQKMDRLINAILKLSREGRRKLTAERIDVVALVEAQGASLAQQFAARDGTLTVKGVLPALQSDRLAVEQIFGNLIENAVKYLMPHRPGSIVVSGRAEGAWLTYDIADNGRGIKAEDFERVFELFRRSGEQNTPGEGIGLAYVRNLARRLGGNVTLHSALGEGSTFTVVLPASFRARDERTTLEL